MKTNTSNGQGTYNWTFNADGSLSASKFIGTLQGNCTGSAGSVSWSNVTGKPYNSDGTLNITANGVTVRIGAQNSSWVHYYSSSVNHIFDNSVYAINNFYLYSDRTKKKDIQKPSRTSLERLYEVSDKLLKKYTLKSSGEESYGYIAQELEQYIPEAVTHGPDESRTVSYNVANSVIIAALVQKVKELEDIIKNGRN